MNWKGCILFLGLKHFKYSKGIPTMIFTCYIILTNVFLITDSMWSQAIQRNGLWIWTQLLHSWEMWSNCHWSILVSLSFMTCGVGTVRTKPVYIHNISTIVWSSIVMLWQTLHDIIVVLFRQKAFIGRHFCSRTQSPTYSHWNLYRGIINSVYKRVNTCTIFFQIRL